MFCGTITCAWPTISSTWKLIAVAWQSWQCAKAYASFLFSTVFESAHTIAKATSYTTVPLRVFTARVWLSPRPGGAGRLNGNTQVGAVDPSGALLRGTSTSESAGWSAVGAGPASDGQTVTAELCRP